MSFLIWHGWQNRRPTGHWQRWLADRLAEHGDTVRYPQFPDPDHPDRAAWLGLAARELDALPDDGERVVVAHSLGCLVWLGAVAEGLVTAPVSRVLLVAPPSPGVAAGIPELAPFRTPRLTAGDLAGAAKHRTRLVGSDDDPYCPGGAPAEYGARLDLDSDAVHGQGHLDLPAGYGPWPSVLAWCLDPATRLTARA